MVLLLAAEIVAIALVFVSGLYADQWPAWGLAGLAVGSGWLGIVHAVLMRLAGSHGQA